MIAYEGKLYHCADCGCALRYEQIDTKIAGRRMMLIHDPFPDCKQAGKTYYVPKVELAEFKQDYGK